MSEPPRRSIQFVSKPIGPPYRDGSKCLVRDLCLHLRQSHCHVLTAGGDLGELEGAATGHAIYGRAGSYRPGLVSNMRAAAWLALTPAPDVWHFVFAPNRRSSQVGAWLKRVRSVPTVQTIASPPRAFEDPDRLLFGDRVVAQSRWTRDRFEASYRALGRPAPSIEVIFPPAPSIERVSALRMQEQRAALGLPAESPVFLYPGDLEVSCGAEKTIEIAAASSECLPNATTVLAYRRKTAAAEGIAAGLRRRTDPARVKVVADVADIHALVQTATAVLFPVDDLYGKVDLPIVLLEAFVLGTPVFALGTGPLADLAGAELLPDATGVWRSALSELCAGSELRGRLRERGRRAVAAHFAPSVVAARYQTVYDSLW